jgi:acetyl-CoA C-acetyltransferase
MTHPGRADDRAPCVIGVGQVAAHSSDAGETEPMELWAQAGSLALADSGSRRAVPSLDSLSVVRCDSWSYDRPAQRLAERLGFSPRHLIDSPLGGHQPQVLLHTVSDAIAGGRMGLALIVSGEALYTAAALGRRGDTLPWGHPARAPGAVNMHEYFHESEVRHGMLPIMRSFALRDTARRAHLGVDVEEYAREPAPIYAAMSDRAVANPYAWHRTAKTPEEILRIGPDNRMPVHPYPKSMMASPNVNLAAALLVASQATADALGVPADRRVYLRGWSSARDHPYVAENEDLWRSCAMEQATAHALRHAGLGLDDLNYFDLYSCFPAALRFATDALGRRLDDKRGVTVTGGMPYAGAPGSGYVTHALATMTSRLREGAGSGLVSGLSAQMATHAFTVLSAVPGRGDPAGFGSADSIPPPGIPTAIRSSGRGAAEVEAYAVACTYEGADELAVAICGLPDGARCYAQTDDDTLLSLLTRAEGVGRRVELVAGPGGRTQITC